MSKVLLVTISMVFVLVFKPAFLNAQELPLWQLSKSCAGEGDGAACAAFESNAYSRLSGRWSTIAPQIRKLCLDDAESSQHQSYRLLNLCLEDEIGKARAKARGETDLR